MSRVFTGFFLLITLSVSVLEAQVFKCNVEGNTVYQSIACDGTDDHDPMDLDKMSFGGNSYDLDPETPKDKSARIVNGADSVKFYSKSCNQGQPANYSVLVTNHSPVETYRAFLKAEFYLSGIKKDSRSKTVVLRPRQEKRVVLDSRMGSHGDRIGCSFSYRVKFVSTTFGN